MTAQGGIGTRPTRIRVGLRASRRLPAPGNLVGAGNSVTSRYLGVFVDQTAEPVPSQDPDIRAQGRRTFAPDGRALVERPVRAMDFIVIDVLAQDHQQKTDPPAAPTGRRGADVVVVSISGGRARTLGLGCAGRGSGSRRPCGAHTDRPVRLASRASDSARALMPRSILRIMAKSPNSMSSTPSTAMTGCRQS